ncbi:hypothetical protein CEUSTIGMA_g10696.t1 [Chlamydomonas eustigma]|uniref:Uncharacterized protein n=1 Tax=Chlamydomonas eustigma TaxID=1157962 RepID=A0A250XKD7_9CHLO|nr:hypothetical protein CEUSTIGMA_g10696.t1 [Chlamydomonas eustigma]|eukprot:GAX83270.1 hypothetical protein CEUSTIGMA_g10696.t1 [Chlamydomonas eustigma]
MRAKNFAGGAHRTHSINLSSSSVITDSRNARKRTTPSLLTCTYSSVREPKDPSSYTSIEELREELMRGNKHNTFTLTNILNFMAKANAGIDPAAPTSAPIDDKEHALDSINGSSSSSSSERTACSSSSSSSERSRWSSLSSPIAILGGIFLREVSRTYRNLVRSTNAEVRKRLSKGKGSSNNIAGPQEDWPQVDEVTYLQLQPLMGGLLSRRSLRKAAYKFPPLLLMPPAELAVRLVSLKQLLVGCDVALLVEQEPALFLSRSQLDVEQAVQKGMRMLNSGLAGADVYQVVMRDPGLLFLPELEKGISQLRELWDVDEAALGNSDPQMLALAVRALSVSGLPTGI